MGLSRQDSFRILAALAVLAAPAAVAVHAGPAGAAEDRIVIEARRLDPPILRTATEQRVTFVNRTGRPVHVEFQGEGDRHRVFQVPGSIWAIFHRPGGHPYVVHVEGEGAGLRGLVEVEQGPEPALPPTCGSVTVMETCIDP